MSKNVKVNDTTYNGVSVVELPLSSGSGKAQFKDVDEIMTPSGTKTITENGTHDVTNFAQAVVNVPTSGGNASSENTYEMGTFTIAETTKTYTYEHNLGRVPKFAIVYPISVEAGQSAYQIMTELIINGLGQEDFDGSTHANTYPNTPYVLWYGSGYNATVSGNGARTGDIDERYDIPVPTETSVTVGSYYTQSASSGTLVAGNYGIIVG
jgi:hypothetical protein